MEDLLSKEHYCCKILTLMKRSAYLLFCSQPPYMGYTSHFYKKIWIPSMIFQKSQPPINKGIHAMNITYDPLKQS